MNSMHRSTRLIGIVVMALAYMVIGCAKPPTEEIAAAQATIDSVKALPDVQTYAMDGVSDAEQSLARVRQLSQEERYDEARAGLPGVFSKARASVGAAAAAKEAARVAAERAIADAKAAIAAAEEKIPQAPRWGKGAIRDRSVLHADVAAAKADVEAAEAAFGMLDYRGASAKARSGMSKASVVTQAVDDALALRSRPR